MRVEELKSELCRGSNLPVVAKVESEKMGSSWTGVYGQNVYRPVTGVRIVGDGVVILVDYAGEGTEYLSDAAKPANILTEKALYALLPDTGEAVVEDEPDTFGVATKPRVVDYVETERGAAFVLTLDD